MKQIVKFIALALCALSTQDLLGHYYTIINKTGDPKKVWRVWVKEKKGKLGWDMRYSMIDNHFPVDVYPENNTESNLATFVGGENQGKITHLDVVGRGGDDDGFFNLSGIFNYSADFVLDQKGIRLLRKR